MISVAIECLSAVAPRVPTLLTFDPLCQAGAPDARTDPPGPEQWLLQTWPINRPRGAVHGLQLQSVVLSKPTLQLTSLRAASENPKLFYCHEEGVIALSDAALKTGGRVDSEKDLQRGFLTPDLYLDMNRSEWILLFLEIEHMEMER
ncbi:hypothetical protein QQF64_024969 [Cirrhinus molitorella]|uniref:Uncharacterized protein n=1 Tax=Cirrhinus molitorella TaxID=172907 RepID=A0ABR3NNB8_9TELE